MLNELNLILPKFEYIMSESGSRVSRSSECMSHALLESLRRRHELQNQFDECTQEIRAFKIKLIIFRLLIFGFFLPILSEELQSKRGHLQELNEEIEGCFTRLGIKMDLDLRDKYNELNQQFRRLMTCSKIWDITETVEVDRKATRSAANNSINRVDVNLELTNLPILLTEYEAMHFQNVNGGQLYLYPPFMIIIGSDNRFGLIDIRDLRFELSTQRFIEEDAIPADAERIDYTWAKVNRDGSRDKRFKNNYQIPILKYGKLTISSRSGLLEVYSFSSYHKLKEFHQSLAEFQAGLCSVED